MKRTLTTIRCVPRFGYENTEVRTVDLDLPEHYEPESLLAVLRAWFHARGLEEAVYDIEADDNGFFAIINDEAYELPWGAPLL